LAFGTKTLSESANVRKRKQVNQLLERMAKYFGFPTLAFLDFPQ